MRFIVVAALAFIAVPAGSQTRVISPPYTGTGESANFSSIAASGNPALRRIRLEKALQLKAEALRLQAADGGVLTPDHQSYINRRAERILAIQ